MPCSPHRSGGSRRGGGGGGGTGGTCPPPFRSSNYIFIAQYSVFNCNLKVQQQKASALRAGAVADTFGGGGGGGGVLIDVQMLQQQKQ